MCESFLQYSFLVAKNRRRKNVGFLGISLVTRGVGGARSFQDMGGKKVAGI